MKIGRLFFCALALGLISVALAQVPPEVHLQHNLSMPFYRVTPTRKFLDMIITGTNLARLDDRNVRVDQFELRNFRDGDPRQVQIIAQAPECKIDVVRTIGTDDGPVHIFTPTTNLYVQGVGFYFTQSNQFVRISNEVETRVYHSLLKTSPTPGARTNPPAGPEQLLKIFAHACRYDFVTKIVNYTGHVHVIDPQLDMTSARLDIQLTTNSTVKSILASDNVIMTTTNHGWATADTSFYYATNFDVTNTAAVVTLTGNAVWHNGDEKAVADKFIYDGARHLLTGLGRVRVWWPNPSGPVDTNSPGLRVGTNGYREIFADYITLQMPPTNGPIQSMTARTNVIIVNQADKSRALAAQAVYQRASDTFELTGEPVWWNDTMKVQGEALTADLGTKTYHAQTVAQLQITSTNQTVLIFSDSLDYQTNLATFTEHVHARVFRAGQLQDTLTCHRLKVGLLNNQIEKVFAFGDVAGETAPDRAGVKKTLSCDQVMLLRSVTTGLIKNIEAEGHVVLQEVAFAPIPLRDKLSADVVTARFSTVTNQIERAIADRNVVLDQIKAGRTIHATSQHAVYDAGLVDQVKLTGTPLAHTDNFAISEADFMIWKPKANIFKAWGAYKIIPLKPQKSQHL
jgi:lipopolysaccharide export system protein LptA